MLTPEIRLLEKHEEFRKCETAQKSIWGGLSVAAEVMLVTQKAGGAVLGAFASVEKWAGCEGHVAPCPAPVREGN